MKLFLYCENQEGGMDYFIFEGANAESSLSVLPGWLRKAYSRKDKMLLDWVKIAEVGSFYEHRLGVCVRLQDDKNLNLKV